MCTLSQYKVFIAFLISIASVDMAIRCFGYRYVKMRIIYSKGQQLLDRAHGHKSLHLEVGGFSCRVFSATTGRNSGLWTLCLGLWGEKCW